ncbi:hypothetical protein [Volucribacter amazonae]|uniref:Uncharacterized protein n=1 Tax=Volucribacter amazonae TaxID=256731 RepID=A0A9X4PA50_9PAST|nr:hypothetical protein [Volucribacter amazonae]MDG6894517.1 hypothetical protein [Volucribacter amazonae]
MDKFYDFLFKSTNFAFLCVFIGFSIVALLFIGIVVYSVVLKQSEYLEFLLWGFLPLIIITLIYYGINYYKFHQELNKKHAEQLAKIARESQIRQQKLEERALELERKLANSPDMTAEEVTTLLEEFCANAPQKVQSSKKEENPLIINVKVTYVKPNEEQQRG